MNSKKASHKGRRLTADTRVERGGTHTRVAPYHAGDATLGGAEFVLYP